MKHRVVLVDDHAILTDGLKRLLEHDPHFEVVASFTAARFALSFIQGDGAVDLVIIDHSMPDMTGIEFIRKLKSYGLSSKVIMLTMHDEPTIIKDAIADGVDGYVLKKTASAELSHAMREVMKGQPYWSADVGQLLFRTARENNYGGNPLTDREEEILKLIVRELTSKEIAAQLFISERTVEVHRKNLMRKVNCTNTVGLIKYAYSKGLI